MTYQENLRDLYPKTLERNDNALWMGGVSIKELVETYETPLYVMDVETIRQSCRQYTSALNEVYPNHLVCYAGKANSNIRLIQTIKDEGLGVDVVSEGELETAIRAGVDPQKILFHGNNKSENELKMAIRYNVMVVIDNVQELKKLMSLKEGDENGRVLPCLIRFKPEIEADTHSHIQTGQLDSKFGVSRVELDRLIQDIQSCSKIQFKGIHSHIGSQIFELDPYLKEIQVLVKTIREIKAQFQLDVEVLNIGGGFGIQYRQEESPLDVSNAVRVLAQNLREQCQSFNLKEPKLILEPGRSIVGTAGITLYSVGTIKAMPSPSSKKYLFIDGGMADNPRPILYQSQYTWELDGKSPDVSTERYSIAGKFCESGDILAENVRLPEAEVGDILCVFGTGAYNYAMASNYNRFCRPAMVAVDSGKSNIWVQRETVEDLLRFDCLI